VAVRTPISIFILGALLVGNLTPTGVCALMCQRHSRAEGQHHCVQPPGAMPGMAHNHSDMHPLAVADVTAAVEAPSCQTECAKGERLSVARKVVAAVTRIPTGIVILDATSEFLLARPVAAWSLDSGPPSAFFPHTVSYGILRI
jgi:hypothetical protein